MIENFYNTIITQSNSAIDTHLGSGLSRTLKTPEELVNLPVLNNKYVYINVVQGDLSYNQELSTTKTSAYDVDFIIRLVKGYRPDPNNQEVQLKVVRQLQEIALAIRKNIRPQITGSLRTDITNITAPDLEIIESAVVIDINLIVKYRLQQ